jgi:hypothetical protein
MPTVSRPLHPRDGYYNFVVNGKHEYRYMSGYEMEEIDRKLKLSDAERFVEELRALVKKYNVCLMGYDDGLNIYGKDDSHVNIDNSIGDLP